MRRLRIQVAQRRELFCLEAGKQLWVKKPGRREGRAQGASQPKWTALFGAGTVRSAPRGLTAWPPSAILRRFRRAQLAQPDWPPNILKASESESPATSAKRQNPPYSNDSTRSSASLSNASPQCASGCRWSVRSRGESRREIRSHHVLSRTALPALRQVPFGTGTPFVGLRRPWSASIGGQQR